MVLSDAEFIAIVQAAGYADDAPNAFSCGRNDLREMFKALGEFEFKAREASPLGKFCECGARYGIRKLETTVSPELLSLMSEKAKGRFKKELERILARATRPCLTLELNAFSSAFAAIRPERGALLPALVEREFLKRKPADALMALFKKFPVLARLWCELISQWRDQIAELLMRFSADQHSLSRTFFQSQPAGKIVDLGAGLSDPHNGGRAAMLLKLNPGNVIYKPRSGTGEQEWFDFLSWLNRQGFKPKFRTARLLLRKSYCWMEEIRFAFCKNRAEVARFYRRMGGLIGAAYLLRAADCHRENVIASGEHPVLIDAEALWHMGSQLQTQTLVGPLFQTGFLPSSKKRSALNQASVLGKTSVGHHLPRIGGKPFIPARYQKEIVKGFRAVWRSTLGSKTRRSTFARRTRLLRLRTRRVIYRSTKFYNSIRRISVQPAALRSGVERDELIARLLRREGFPQSALQEELRALKRLDVPYFTRRSTAGSRPSANNASAPIELIRAILEALRF